MAKGPAIPSEPPTPEAESKLRSLGRYRILEELGRGGQGIVYKAHDPTLDRTIALKTLLAGPGGASPDVVERFLSEARAAARLRHPNIVAVHDVGTSEGVAYFTMDLIEGEGLNRAMKLLPLAHVVEVLRDAALALHAADEAGLLHRDVKPSNILVDPTGRAYLADFGLVKFVAAKSDTALTKSGQFPGTPAYMAPERWGAFERKVGPPSDVWSLGVVLYEALAGRRPYPGNNNFQILAAVCSSEAVRPPSRPAPVAPEAEAQAEATASNAERPEAAAPQRLVPAALETICLRCLEKDPTRRYPSACDLAEELDQWLLGELAATAGEFGRHNRTSLVTLLFTDLVGSTRLKEEKGDREGVALLLAHSKRVRELLSQVPDGREISTAGDSFFCAFVRPSDAVGFALRVQAAMRREFAAAALSMRIGIHLGEVILDDAPGAGKREDLLGREVDAAARVMSLGQGGQVLCTRAVFDAARRALKGREVEGIGALAWLSHGPYELKGVEDPIEVCEVGEEEAGVLRAPGALAKARPVRAGSEEPGWRPAPAVKVPGTEWVLEERLGEGGFGEVWRAAHRWTKEKRVFKFCFHRERVRSLKHELALFRLIREGIGEHPNIVRLHEVYLEKPPYYLGMEWVRGKDLGAWLNEPVNAERGVAHGRDGPGSQAVPRLTTLLTTAKPIRPIEPPAKLPAKRLQLIVHFPCAKCGVIQRVARMDVGETRKCSKCRHSQVVPKPSAAD